MSTSGNGLRAFKAGAVGRYAVAAAGCAVFALVYAQFSHGVHSPFMTYLFVIPLVGGAVSALVLKLAKAGCVPLVARQLWALAVASLAIASCLRGVFDIAGTSSIYLVVYLAAAAAFAVAAIVSLVRARES